MGPLAVSSSLPIQCVETLELHNFGFGATLGYSELFPSTAKTKMRAIDLAMTPQPSSVPWTYFFGPQWGLYQQVVFPQRTAIAAVSVYGGIDLFVTDSAGVTQ